MITLSISSPKYRQPNQSPWLQSARGLIQNRNRIYWSLETISVFVAVEWFSGEKRTHKMLVTFNDLMDMSAGCCRSPLRWLGTMGPSIIKRFFSSIVNSWSLILVTKLLEMWNVETQEIHRNNFCFLYLLVGGFYTCLHPYKHRERIYRVRLLSTDRRRRRHHFQKLLSF